MKKIKIIFLQVVILTITSLLLRTISISFRVYLSNQLGASGMGLYQLVQSIYYLAITFSTSGIKLAATRLVAEELAVGRTYGAKKAVKNCLYYAILFGGSFSVLLSISANYVGTNWLGDNRTVLSLHILAFSLPFLAMSSVMSGYFMAVRKIINTSSVQIIEQIIKISVTVGCLSFFLLKGLEYACAAIVIGSCVGEYASSFLLYFLYRLDIRRYRSSNTSSHSLLSRMLKIALPVALSTYITSAIHTMQQVFIPQGLKKSGASTDTALATYGMIHGMVMPIIMFPSAILNAISDLIVPELAECQVSGSKKRQNYIIERVLNLSLLTSLCIMCIFFRFANELGFAIYHSYDAGNYIRILSPIIPIMYLDKIVDSMQKGIGEQVRIMRYNIAESVVSLLLTYFLLPKYAIVGYIFTLCFSRILNFSLSIHRLIIVTNLKIKLLHIIKSFVCIFCSIGIVDLLGYFSKSILQNYNLYWVNITIVIGISFLLLRLTSCITRDELQWLRSIFK